MDPTSTEGHKAAWKKAQKKPKKSISSEAINNMNPKRKPERTAFVWNPDKVASLTISLNHIKIHKLKHIKPKTNNIPPKGTLCI